jgi:hypothetical protein
MVLADRRSPQRARPIEGANMASNTTVLIVVTALAVRVLAATLVVVAYKTRTPHRHATDKTTNDRFAGDAVPAQVEIKTIVARPRDGDRKSVAASRRSPAIY